MTIGRAALHIGLSFAMANVVACSGSDSVTTHGTSDADAAVAASSGSSSGAPGDDGAASTGASDDGGTSGTGTPLVDSAGGNGGDGAASTTPASARVRMLHRVTSDDDNYMTGANGTNTAAKAWLTSHWSAFEGFSGGPTPAATHWLTGGLLYWDTTAVNTASNPPSARLLKRPSTSETCYNPWGGNPNPQVTWDVTSEATRQYLIGQMKTALAHDAWSGFWLDDVNLDVGSSCVGPNDETWYTEFGASWPDTWADAVATFVEEIRAAFPHQTLLENAPWFSRSPARFSNRYVARQLKTATLANREGGVVDSGLTTGTGVWSVNALLDYVDAVHANGAGVVWDSFPSNATEQAYALAAYFIGYTDKDFYGDASARQPSSWPSLYDVDLGAPAGPRTFDGKGRFTRPYAKGTVVLDVAAKTGTIPGH